jgi:DNA modification methylase
MKIEKKKIKDLIPAFYNPRRSTPKQEKNLAESLKKFGVVEPIIWNKQTKNIVGGHFRVRELEKLGFAEVDCVVIDLSLDDEKELNIRLNANTGDWDWPALDEQFDFKQLETWGLEFPELEGQEEKLEAVEDDFESEPIEEIKTDIKHGDIIQIGSHRLMCGDSTELADVERLMDGAKADMVFTDPPYGVDYDGGHAVKGVRREKLHNDDNADIYGRALPLMFANTNQNAPLYLWYSDSKSLAVLSAVLSAGYEVRNNIIWNKNLAQFGAIGAQYKTKHEPCLYCFKKGQSVNWIGPNNEVSVWDISRESKNEFHPTQKPIPLVARALKNHEAKSVLDLFLGSGSTMVACHQLKRVCYGMELEPKYCQVIIDRMKKLDPDIKIAKV